MCIILCKLYLHDMDIDNLSNFYSLFSPLFSCPSSPFRVRETAFFHPFTKLENFLREINLTTQPLFLPLKNCIPLRYYLPIEKRPTPKAKK